LPVSMKKGIFPLFCLPVSSGFFSPLFTRVKRRFCLF
jgi:hypothetical protein